MAVLFAGQPCVDPAALRRQCLERGLSAAWAQAGPNSFTCPLGAAPGEGWLLLTRAALEAISADLSFPDLYDLVFRSDAASGPWAEVTLKSLTVVGAECVTPGAPAQKEAACLVRVADKRHLYSRIPIDKAYNCVDRRTGADLAPTLNGGSPWTWDQLGADLWGAVGTTRLGAWPGLPFTPDGTPGAFEFWQQSALAALDTFLGRLGCALRHDPTAGTFGVVRLGAADAAHDEAAARWDKYRHWEGESPRAVRGVIPPQVRVLFRRVPRVRDGLTPYWSVLRSDPTGRAVAGNTEAGTVALLHDDLEALGSAGTPSNDSACTARAAERAADWYRQAWALAEPLRRVYPLPLAGGLLPGSQVRCVRWGETAHTLAPGRGTLTEITRVGKVPALPPWSDEVEPAGAAGGAVSVRENSAGAVYTRPRLNFIEGSGVTLTVADDATDDEVDITVASTPSLAAFTGARVLVSVSQSITVSETALALTTEDFDAGGLHAGTDAYFTLGVGYWAFGIHVEANIASAGELQIRPHLGGSAYGSGVTGYRPSTAYALRMGMADVAHVVSGTSQLEFRISRSGGSNFTLAGGYAWVSKVG